MVRQPWCLIALFVLCFGCTPTTVTPDGGSPTNAANAGNPLDAGTTATRDAATNPGPDSGNRNDAGSELPPPGQPGPDAGASAIDAGAGAASMVTRFVALGDSGRGNAGQYLVAEAIAAVCADRGGCDFALMLGDNIYNSGVSAIDDAQWQEKFEQPYADLDFPFYVTLGNHDLGGDGSGNEPSRGDFQVQYAATSDKFMMPATHYRVTHGLAELVSVNTTSMYYAESTVVARLLGYDTENDAQRANLESWNQTPNATWRIAFGHHPYLSNGPHGNAGRYDGNIPGFFGSGDELKSFFESHVLGHFDLYLSGHDHSLQDFGATNGTEVIVSGGGATHTRLDGENDVLWQKNRRGFLLLEATTSQLILTFVVVPDDGDAQTSWYLDHTRILVR